jgi:hypothetical protein
MKKLLLVTILLVGCRTYKTNNLITTDSTGKMMLMKIKYYPNTNTIKRL